MTTITLRHGDNRQILRELADGSVDSVVTDAPYGLSDKASDPAVVARILAAWLAGEEVEVGGAGFMAKAWDAFVPGPAVWRECFRVLKPGGHMVVFFGTRTYDLGAIAIRLAGFEVRDMLSWLYGSGFPKNHDVAKAIDKLDAVGPRRERALKFTAWMRSTGITGRRINELTGTRMASHYLTAGEQPEVATRAHFETLRPALPAVPDWVEQLIDAREVESANLARREVVGVHEDRAHAAKWRESFTGAEAAPAGLITKAYTPEARAWEGWGTALKPALEPVVLARKPLAGTIADNVMRHGTGALNIADSRVGDEVREASFTSLAPCAGKALGAAGTAASRRGTQSAPKTYIGRWPANVVHDGSPEVVNAFPETGPGQIGGVNDPNGAFGYQGGAGGMRLPGVPDEGGSAARFFYTAKADAEDRLGSKHPTVKPVDLMAWLCRLITPPGGTIVDPFAGTGTTGIAAAREGFACILIEREAEYVADIERRLAWQRGEGRLTALEQARDLDPAKAAGADLPLFGGAE